MDDARGFQDTILLITITNLYYAARDQILRLDCNAALFPDCHLLCMLFNLPANLNGLISILLGASSPAEHNTSPAITFQLRHRHAATSTSRIIFSDIPHEFASSDIETQFSIPTKVNAVPRPQSFAAFNEARRNPQRDFTPALDWHDWDVASPDISKRTTLFQLAKMSFDAYAADNKTEWYDLSDSWNSTTFGWLPEDDGMRGHIFVSTDNSTVVIAIKGTSASWLAGGGGPTVEKDKKNDNLLFSCCCARVGPTWSTVCGCYDGGYRCDSQCVQDALVDEGLYYPTGLVSSSFGWFATPGFKAPLHFDDFCFLSESLQQC